MTHNVGVGTGYHLRALSSHWGNCGHHVVTPLTFLMPSLLVSGVGAASLCVLGFSQWYLVHEQLLIVLLMRASKGRTGMTYVAILVISLSSIFCD